MNPTYLLQYSAKLCLKIATINCFKHLCRGTYPTVKAVKMKIIDCFSLLFVAVNCYLCGAEEILDIVPGMFSKKVISNGLTLPATSTFKPIPSLTTYNSPS